MKEYIEREAVLNAIEEELSFCEGQDPEKRPVLYGCELGLRGALSYATTLPVADVVERKRGEWEWFEEWNPSTPDHPRECEDCGWRCGKCKTALEDMVGGYWDDPTERPKLNFCPNCGADMRGEKLCTE